MGAIMINISDKQIESIDFATKLPWAEIIRNHIIGVGSKSENIAIYDVMNFMNSVSRIGFNASNQIMILSDIIYSLSGFRHLDIDNIAEPYKEVLLDNRFSPEDRLEILIYKIATAG